MNTRDNDLKLLTNLAQVVRQKKDELKTTTQVSLFDKLKLKSLLSKIEQALKKLDLAISQDKLVNSATLLNLLNNFVKSQQNFNNPILKNLCSQCINEIKSVLVQLNYVSFATSKSSSEIISQIQVEKKANAKELKEVLTQANKDLSIIKETLFQKSFRPKLGKINDYLERIENDSLYKKLESMLSLDSTKSLNIQKEIALLKHPYLKLQEEHSRLENLAAKATKEKHVTENWSEDTCNDLGYMCKPRCMHSGTRIKIDIVPDLEVRAAAKQQLPKVNLQLKEALLNLPSEKIVQLEKELKGTEFSLDSLRAELNKIKKSNELMQKLKKQIQEIGAIKDPVNRVQLAHDFLNEAETYHNFAKLYELLASSQKSMLLELIAEMRPHSDSINASFLERLSQAEREEAKKILAMKAVNAFTSEVKTTSNVQKQIATGINSQMNLIQQIEGQSSTFVLDCAEGKNIVEQPLPSAPKLDVEAQTLLSASSRADKKIEGQPLPSAPKLDIEVQPSVSTSSRADKKEEKTTPQIEGLPSFSQSSQFQSEEEDEQPGMQLQASQARLFKPKTATPQKVDASRPVKIAPAVPKTNKVIVLA